MKIRVSSLQLNVAIFQAICAFLVGLLTSTQLLSFLSCHAVGKLEDLETKSIELNGGADEIKGKYPNNTLRDIDNQQEQEEENDGGGRDVNDDDENEDESRPTNLRLRIGCFILYGEATPAKVLYTSWIAQCDANMTVRHASAFPGRMENMSSSFLSELLTMEKSSQQLDFYLFANHDTYIVMDNLREYLSHCDPDQPLAYGYALVKEDPRNGEAPMYTIGGTMIISRRALLEVSKIEECMTSTLPTTTTILTCLHKSGGNLVDSRDQFAKNTFLAPARPFQIMTASMDKKFVKEQKLSTNYCEDVSCLSDFPVAFHRMTAGEIHLVNFLINWANFSHYTGTNRHSKLRLKFNGSKLPLGPPLNVTRE